MVPYDRPYMTFYWPAIVLVLFLSYLTLTNIAILKSGLEVTQDHSYWYQRPTEIRFRLRFRRRNWPKCSFGSVSVTVPTPHFTFDFGRNYTSHPKLVETGVRRAYGRSTTLNGITYIAQGKEFWVKTGRLNNKEFWVKTIMLLGWTLGHNHNVIHVE